ncbi:MAG: helix-turn-helix transcriptional regulator [Verrucomicrobiota bacterium]
MASSSSVDVVNIGVLIRKDRIGQGLSLRGLAERLNKDKSLQLERPVTTSWLHHLENGRAKPLGPDMKRGLARVLRQDEQRYLSPEDYPQSRQEGFVRFFDEQLGFFESGSALVCDLSTDFSKADDLGEMLICLYHFLDQTNGRVVVFERSGRFALPVFLVAMKEWPNVDDVNLQEVVARIMAPMISGGFVDCPLPTPREETLDWVAEHVDLYELAAEEQVTALMTTEPFSTMMVVSPNQRQGRMPGKRAYYFLGKNAYGEFENGATDQIYRRYEQYRDLDLFQRLDYEEGFKEAYAAWGEEYRLRFGGAA